MRKLYILLSLLFLCPYVSLAEFSSYYRFDHITAVDGLSQSEVFSFCKSETGHIWFGTLDGLNRYDGDEIVTFNTDFENKYAIVGNTVYAIAEDNHLRLWVGTNSGLSLYNIADERFYTIALNKNSKEEIKVIKIYDNKAYIGTTCSLYVIDTESKEIDQVRQSVKQIPLGSLNTIRNVSGIDIDSKGNVWCLTDWQLYNIKNNRVEFVKQLPSAGWVVNMVIDSLDRLWIASVRDKGALTRHNLLDGTTVSFRHNIADKKSLSSNNVSDIAFDNQGTMWVSTRDKGLNRASVESLANDQIDFERIDGISLSNWGLNTNLIYKLYFCDNTLWVGTIGGGVNFYDNNAKRIGSYITPESSAIIRSVYADQDNIYLGVQGNGLHHINRQKREISKIDDSARTIFHIEPKEDDLFWVCSGEGLTIERINNKGVKLFEKILSGSVFYIAQSSENIWWAATFTGLFRIEYRNDKLYSVDHYTDNSTPALSHNNCRVVRYDHQANKIWVGTEGGGLNSITLDELQRPIFNTKFTKENGNSLSSNFVRDIYIQDEHRIWIGTYEGLNVLNIDDQGGYAIDIYKERNGLFSNTIESVNSDKDGNIWVSTSKGISKISNGEFNISNYISSDGLHGLEFAEHSSHMTSHGELVFGGVGGVTIFYPQQITPAPQNNNLSIVEMSLHGNPLISGDTINGKVILPQPIYLTDKVSLNYKQNDFGFKFSAMSFSASDKIIYSYRLLGYDDQWRTTTSLQRTANYTNISHGKYQFQVKVIDETGNWSPTKSIVIDIITPFFLKWYMIFIYIVSAISIIIVVIVLFVRRRKRLLQAVHREELYELEQARVRFYINMSHDLQTPLTLILGPLNQLLSKYKFEKNVEDRLSLIDRNAKKLLEMINQTLEIRKSEIGALQIRNQSVEICTFVRDRMTNFKYAFNEKSVKFELKCTTSKVWTLVDADILDKILYNIISNALKYTDQGKVSITVSLKDGKILIAVKDSGRGIAADQLDAIFVRFYNNTDGRKGSYGIGLAHCKEMAKLLSGTIAVESEFGVGSTFTLTIPVIEIESEEAKEAKDEVYIEHAEEITSKHSDERSTLLIVEDEADMQEFIRSIFDSEYNVLQAINGEEALDMLKAERIDIVVSDVVMPKMNGVEMCNAIKNSEELRHIPVILLTALKGEHARYQGLEVGADDYLNKPFDEKELLLKVRNILTTKQGLTNLFNAQFMLKITPSNIESYDAEFLERVIDYMERHYSDPNFSIEELERQMAMSHASFYRKIKSITGNSMKELLTNYRLERSRILVEESDMRISEIAFATGFNSSAYFSNCFKKKYGSIALEHRRELLNK